MPKVLVTCAQMQAELPVHAERLRAAGLEVEAPPLPGQQFSSAQLSKMMTDVVGMIAGDDELDRAFFRASPKLQALIRWGIGMDSVDHAAARDHGVAVCNTPAVFGGEVADSALTYMLMLARRHHMIDQAVRSGSWPKYEGLSLSGETVGIVGQGDIGAAVASRALGFGMSVMAFDPYVASERLAPGVGLVESINDLLASSRFVVLTCPLTPETRHLIDADALKGMRRDSFLINVARGPVVDELALVEALDAGQIAGAGLDVFEVEPLPDNSPLRGFDSVILGAHNGSNTRQGVARASQRAVDLLLERLGHGS
ncbi:phosphoglycerate dehydrogenase [Nocardioides koreensis]|uniref:Phosphoglycerate dehydrogenase n=1 Tax=Nocardioides koreensis TaxID=433651 RepID=A0ABN2Z7F0_9ACTN